MHGQQRVGNKEKLGEARQRFVPISVGREAKVVARRLRYEPDNVDL